MGSGFHAPHQTREAQEGSGGHDRKEKETGGDPEPEAKAWAATLSEVDRKWDRYQEMFAADTMTLDELRTKLNALDETRERCTSSGLRSVRMPKD